MPKLGTGKYSRFKTTFQSSTNRRKRPQHTSCTEIAELVAQSVKLAPESVFAEIFDQESLREETVDASENFENVPARVDPHEVQRQEDMEIDVACLLQRQAATDARFAKFAVPNLGQQGIAELMSLFSTKCALSRAQRQSLVQLIRIVVMSCHGDHSQVPIAYTVDNCLKDVGRMCEAKSSFYCSAPNCLSELQQATDHCRNPNCHLFKILRRPNADQIELSITTMSLASQIKIILAMHFKEFKQNLELLKNTTEFTEIIQHPMYRERVGNNPKKIGDRNVWVVSLMLNHDGIPVLEKTGSGHFWISNLGIVELPSRIRSLMHSSVFYGCIYSGRSPSRAVSDLFFQRLISEVSDTQQDPFSVEIELGKSELFMIKLYCCISDGPARAYLFQHQSHTAHFGCILCFQSAVRVGNNEVWIPRKRETVARKTPEVFERLAQRMQQKYGFASDKHIGGILGYSSLLKHMPNTAALGEVMHLVFEGLFPAIRELQLGSDNESQKGKMTAAPDFSMLPYRDFITRFVEDALLPTRFLKYLKDPFRTSRYNAWMTMILYLVVWPVCMVLFVPRKFDTVYLVYVLTLIMRTLSKPVLKKEDFDLIKEMIDVYKWAAADLLGLARLTYNYHVFADHLPDLIEWGNPMDLTGFYYEMWLGYLRRNLKSGNFHSMSSSFATRAMAVRHMSSAGTRLKEADTSDKIAEFMESLMPSSEPSSSLPHQSEVQLLMPCNPKQQSSSELQFIEKFSLEAKGLRYYECFKHAGVLYASDLDYARRGTSTSRCFVFYRSVQGVKKYGLIQRCCSIIVDSRIVPVVFLRQLRWKKSVLSMMRDINPPEQTNLKDFFERHSFNLESWWAEVEPLSEDIFMKQAHRIAGYIALMKYNNPVTGCDRYFVSDLEMRRLQV